jgi:hypothetical protein
MMISLSEPLGPQQGVGEIDEDAEGHEAGERIVEDHFSSPLQPVTEEGVGDRERKKTDDGSQQYEVQHLVLLAEGRASYVAARPGTAAAKPIETASGLASASWRNNCLGVMAQ